MLRAIEIPRPACLGQRAYISERAASEALAARQRTAAQYRGVAVHAGGVRYRWLRRVEPKGRSISINEHQGGNISSG